jgi:pimeloyl-ACP methyl ester carboxylesterase
MHRVALDWEARGDGRITVVVLPWFGVDRSFAAAAFEPAVGDLDLRRVYVDLPGCGRSPTGPATSNGIVDQLVQLVDRQLPPGPLLLAGFSYGGYLAAGLTRRSPDRFDGLFLAGGSKAAATEVSAPGVVLAGIGGVPRAPRRSRRNRF